LDLSEISVGLYGRASVDHKPNLFGLVRQTMRLKHDRICTERTPIEWIQRFMLCRERRHPAAMGAPEGHTFLSHLAVEHQVVASTPPQA
jgi:hypothetical protein